MVKSFREIYAVIIFVLLISCGTDVLSQRKSIVKKSIAGNNCRIIPLNTKKTILILGGTDTKDEKSVWYKEIEKENK